MKAEELQLLARLIREHRWGALATLGPDGPESSWVAYAYEADFSAFVLHLSRLASHTRNLLAEPRASLAVTQQERPDSDPQQLARLSLQGLVDVPDRQSATYQRLADVYCRRLPDARPLFDFADFMLFRLRPRQARWVGGFARAYTVSAPALRKASSL